MNGAGAVGILFQEIIHRRVGEGRWCWGQLNSMPPEIQGPARPTRGWFDNMIIIDKIVVVRFVQGPLDAAAQFGKDHEFQVFVFSR